MRARPFPQITSSQVVDRDNGGCAHNGVERRGHLQPLSKQSVDKPERATVADRVVAGGFPKSAARNDDVFGIAQPSSDPFCAQVVVEGIPNRFPSPVEGNKEPRY